MAAFNLAIEVVRSSVEVAVECPFEGVPRAEDCAVELVPDDSPFARFLAA